MKIAVGGMISSGKSTLVKDLGATLNIPVMDEFEDDDKVFDTLLGWLYEGKEDVEMLLQVYFLHHHWKTQTRFKDNVIVDRHIIEHWLFAQKNLQHLPTIMTFYNNVFHSYMQTVIQPDLYIILDVNYESFKDRIFKRGRKQEVENFNKNKEYFKNLLSNYTELLKAQCVIYDIPYVLIDTNGKTSEQVLTEAIGHLGGHKNDRQ